MSKQVDERVVSMQFDNKQFESNVKTTMGTLERLKQSLNFTGSTKGLENINSAAEKVNITGMSNAVDSISLKFSGLEVVAVTALANITNSVINAGKRMISSLTIAPISQGYDEYELKMGSIQTIMASTGESLETVNKYLDELNVYADKTIYSFADMTNNIGKFTNAGVKLEDAVKAIQGVSNEAAVSGANANEASRAMYNFAQALSAGYVKLIDWKSIETANMATVEFKNNLIQTALEMGTLTKVGDKYKSVTKDLNGKVSEAFTATSNFNESLSHQWMTTDVLVKTLGDYADETTEIGKKAFAAAQDVKTFSQLLDTLKEAVGSGWARTFEIIFGDFEQAKKLWTSINNVLSPIIDAISDARNNLLDEAFNGNPLQKLAEKLETIIKPAKDVADATNKVTTAMKDYNAIVNKVIAGDYGNGKSRWEKLAKEGYDWAKVQNLVNEKSGDSYRHSEKLGKEQDNLQETQATTIEQIIAMNDAELKNLGLTEEEIKAFRELEAQSKKTGIPIKDLIENIDQLNGRTLLTKSFQNIGSSIAKIFTAIRDAWKDAFPASSMNILYELIAAFHKFSTYLMFSDDAANDLTRTLKGVFAILDIVTSILGGGFKIAFGIGTKVLSEFWKALGFANVNILKVTANIGDAIVAFRNWWEKHSVVNKAIETMVPLLVKAAKAIYNWAKSIYELPAVQSSLVKITETFIKIGENLDKYFGEGAKRIAEFIDCVKAMDGLTLDNFKAAVKDFKENVLDYFFNFDGLLDNIPDNILDGFVQGIKNEIPKVAKAIRDIGETILYTIKTLLGIHSPSTEFESIGSNIILGLCNGIQNGLSMVIDVIKSLISSIFSVFEGVDFTDLFIMGSTVGIGVMLYKGLKIFEKLVNPLDKFGAVLDGVKGVLNSTSNYINEKTKNIKSESLLNIAKAIGILATSLAVLAMIDQDKLWSAVGALGAVTAGLVVLMKVTETIGDMPSFGKISAIVLSLSASILILSIALKKIASIEPDRAKSALFEMTAIFGGLLAVMYMYGKFVDADKSGNIDKAGIMLLKMSVSIGILALVMKLMGKLSMSDIVNGLAVMSGITAMFMAIIAISKYSGDNADKAAKLILKMSVAIGLLALVIKLVGTMSFSDIVNGLGVISGITLMFAAIIAISKYSGDNADKAAKLVLKMSIAIGLLALVMKLISGMSMSDIMHGLVFLANVSLFFTAFMLISDITDADKASKVGNMILKISAAIGILAIAMKIIAGMSMSDIVKGIGVMAGITAIFVAFIYVSKYAGKHADKAGSMLLKMSAAIAVMALSVKIIGRLSTEDIKKGIMFMNALGLFIAAMIAVSQYAGKHADKAGNMLIKMSAGILILVAAIALLSLLDPSDVAVGTTAISALMGMMALLVKVSESVPKKLSPNLIVLTAAVGLLGGILYLLGRLPVQSVMGSATALSLLLISLSASMAILGRVTGVTPNALLAAVALVVIVGLLGGILYLLRNLPVESSIATATALSTLLISLSSCCLILSGVGLTGVSAFVGIGALLALITSVGTLMVAIGALTTYIPQVEEFLDKGITVLEKIGYGLGSFVGNILAGFAEGATSSLPEIGTRLSQFMINLTPFIVGSKMIDSNTMEGVKYLAEAMLILTGTQILDSLTSWFTGGVSLEDFGKELAAFGPYMAQFAKSISGVNPSTIEGAANASKALTEMASSIPKTGGWAQEIMGVQDLKEFGEKIVSFAESLVKFSNIILEGSINETAIQSAVTAGKLLSELETSIPKAGGWAQTIMGAKDLGVFGEQIKKYGSAIVNFSDVLTQNGGIKTEAVQSAADAGSIMAKLQDTLPTDKAWWQFWKEDQMNLKTFGNQLKFFGIGISDFSGAVKDVDGSKLSSVSTGVNSLIEVVKSMEGLDTSGAISFTSAINSLAQTNVKGLIEAFGNYSSQLESAGSNIVSAIAKGITSKKNALSTNVATLMNAVLKAIKDKSTSFASAGTDLINKFNVSITDNESKVKSAFTSVLSKVVSATRAFYNSFYNAGSYLVSGFANGISDNTYKATAKARAMASSAATAARKELNEHSPSKVFYGIGAYAVEGFVKAFGENTSKSYKAGSEIAESATNGLSNAISKVKDILESDMDTQPTIRPVIDLSDVTSGADAINNLLSMNPSVGVLSNVSAISSSMNRNQNGINDDIVSAINDLKRTISDASGDTYNVNGVTYDDGSNISEAVKAIVQAAKIERRR